MDYQFEKFSDNFILASEPEQDNIHICPRSNFFIHSEEKNKTGLPTSFKPKLFVYSPFPSSLKVKLGNVLVLHFLDTPNISIYVPLCISFQIITSNLIQYNIAIRVVHHLEISKK